jgi:hypothetical protein
MACIGAALPGMSGFLDNVTAPEEHYTGIYLPYWYSDGSENVINIAQ